jgi:hypothetical protein
MPEVKETKATWIGRVSPVVALAGSLVALISGALGVWLLWPRLSVMIFGEPFTVAYDYVVIPDTMVHCVATPEESLTIAEGSVSVLQNQCQTDVVANAPSLFRVWYIRVKNTGPDIPKVRVAGRETVSANFKLSNQETTLACLGYEGKSDQASMDWNVSRLDLLSENGGVRTSISLRPPPPADELKIVASSCGPGVILGYPPIGKGE